VTVAGNRQLRSKALQIERVALLEEERASGKILGRREPIERGRHRHDHDIECAAHQLVERCEPIRYEVLVRRNLIVRQRLPIRELKTRRPGAK
jgi:hypothetical protein